LLFGPAQQRLGEIAMWTKIAAFVLASTLALPAYAANPDGWVTTKTKLALWTTAGIPSTEVDVDTIDGVVTLHGKVETSAERAAAEAEAKKIEGVKRVRNLLQVVPSSREKAVAKDDKAIKDAAEKALSSTEGVKGISVKSVNAGVVLLSGKADDLGDQVRAVRAVYGVSGVRRVSSEIQGSEQVFSERDGDAMVPTGKAKPASARRGMNDGWVTTEVKMRLLAEEKVPSLDINVDTRDGVVTLFGTVPSAGAKSAAEAETQKIDGVKRIVNDLQVVPESKKEVVKAEDKDIEKQVKKAFDSREQLKGVDVAVKGGVVRLTGSVPSRMQKLEAVLVSRSTSGVRGVSNDLTVKPKKD